MFTRSFISCFLSSARPLYHSRIASTVCLQFHPNSKSTNILCSLDLHLGHGGKTDKDASGSLRRLRSVQIGSRRSKLRDARSVAYILLSATSTMNEDDQLVSVLPIHFSNALSPNIHIHQFPLLTRPLQVPPTAAASGKRIKARLKPGVRRLELHVPVDTRPEVWNVERSRDLGKARVEDDKEKNQALMQAKQREGEEPRLAEVRMRSEQIPHSGVYVLGIVRDGACHAL